MREKWTVSIDGIQLFLFAVYNFLYDFHMLDTESAFLSRMYFLMLGFYCLFCILRYYSTYRENILFVRERRYICGFIVVFLIITALTQIINFDIDVGLYSEFLYLILPIVVVYYTVNTTGDGNVLPYFYIIFARCVFLFVMQFRDTLSLSTIRAISWGDSMSSAFESSDAHIFLILTLIFLIYNKKALAIISTLFCMLCFKRLSFILAPILLITYRFIPKREVSRKILIITKIVFCLSPFLMLWVIQDGTISWFFNHGIDLDSFMSGRISLIRYALNNAELNGFGSITSYLTAHPYGTYHFISIMHCDLLQFCVECTILGVIVFVNNIIEVAKKDYRVFFVAVYLLLQMVISTMYRGLVQWMLLYFLAYVCSTHMQENNQEICEEKYRDEDY